jgi:hypothetical protein
MFNWQEIIIIVGLLIIIFYPYKEGFVREQKGKIEG